jgi:hypothetical protein
MECPVALLTESDDTSDSASVENPSVATTVGLDFWSLNIRLQQGTLPFLNANEPGRVYL